MATDARRGTSTAHVQIDRGLVAVNALTSVLSHLISIGILLWVNHYLLTRLSAEEYAPFPIVVALFLFLQVLTSLLTGGISRYVTEAYAKADLHRVTEIVSSMLPLILASVFGFWALGGIVTLNVERLLDIDPSQLTNARLMLGLMIFSHGIVLLAMPFSVGLHVRQKFVWLSFIKVGEQILRLVLMLILLFEVSTSVHWVVVATQTAVLTAMGVTVLISIRLIPELRFERRAFRRSTMKELSSFGGWMMLGSLLYRIRTSADVILLNKLSSAVDVNAFHVGRLPDRQMDVLLRLVSITMQPSLVAMHAVNRHESLRRAFLRGNRYYLWATLAVAVPLFVFAEDLVILYAGETYLLAAIVLKARCAAYPFVYANEMLYLVCMAKARIRTFFIIASSAAMVHILAALILVGEYGMGAAGVAWASLAVAVLSQLLLLWPLGMRMLDLPFRRFLQETLLPGYLPAAGALAAGYAAKTVLAPESWLGVSMGVAGCFLVYVALMAVFGAPEDRKDVLILFRHMKTRLRPRTARLGSQG
ncbi:MAG: lipopolysaccharide biosynthesis protein [Alphaproteobacteria bacterium]